MRRRARKVFLIIGVILLIPVIYIALSTKTCNGPTDPTSGTDKDDRKKIKTVFKKHIASLEQNDQSALESLKTNIYVDIQSYKKNTKEFAKELVGFTSSIKIMWKTLKDYVANTNDRVRYVEEMYNKYMFDESKLSGIIQSNHSLFSGQLTTNYNGMMKNTVDEVLATGVQQFNMEKIFEKDFKIKLSLSGQNVDYLAKMSALGPLAASSSFFISASVCDPIIGKIVPLIMSKLLTSFSTKAVSYASSAVTFGASLAISYLIDLWAEKLAADQIESTLNTNIDEISTTVSNKVVEDVGKLMSDYHANVKKTLIK